MQRVADYIADYIYKMGVKNVFMVTGGGMMFLSDGLAQHSKLSVICTHHEQAAAIAAVGYSKYLGSLGVVYMTTGCGGTNALTGLLDAWQDNVPCLFISGQCKRKETIRNTELPLRQFGVQEADIVTIVQSISKYAVMVNEPEKIAWHLDKAVHLARTGRPGPVWIDVPMDVQGAMVHEETLERFDPKQETVDYKTEPTHDELQSLKGLLRDAKRPVIIAGQGIRLASAVSVFRNFVETYHIPVVASRLGIDLLPSSHPLFIGRIGNKGDRAGNFAVQNADLVLAVGSRLSVSSIGHEYATFAREAKRVVVDIDPVEHRKNTIQIDLFINADAGCFFKKLNLDKTMVWKDWAATCLGWKRKWPVFLPEYASSEKVNLYYFVDRLCRKMKPDSVVIADAGSAFFVVSQSGQFTGSQRYITSGGQADMGYTLPAAIGVSVARDHGEVLGITGDGSLQMNIQELQTIIHYKLPIKIFVWNNDGYLSIRATQSKFFGKRFIGTDSQSGVSFPETEKIANAYGIPFFKVRQSAELDGALDQVLAQTGPLICEVLCLRDQEIVPAVASFSREDGTIVSKPLEDMYPFMDRKEFLENMIIKPLDR